MFPSVKNTIVLVALLVIGQALISSVTFAAPVKKTASKKATNIFSSALTAARVAQLKTYATLSSIAYCTISEWICGPYCQLFPDTEVITAFDASNTTGQTGYVAWVPSINEIVVAFRGTLSFQTLMDDANFKLEDYPPSSGAQIHSGFYNNLKSVQPIVLKALKNATAAHPDATITVVGHSLGGAVAVLSALDLFQNNIITTSNAKVFTYGEPRVGNPAFADYVDSTGIISARTTHYNDIIPHLPPESFGFRHHQPEFWIHSNDNTTVACTGQEDPLCIDSTATMASLIAHLLYYEEINFCVY